MRNRTTVAAATVALLLLPTAAWAHPAFSPNQVPAGDTVDAELIVPHGCAPGGGMPDEAEEASPTVELALQHTDGITVTPQAVDGWTFVDDGEAWVWNDDGGATTDVIRLPVTLVLDAGLAADEYLYLKAFQECENGAAFQWIGTPDAEASFPAVRMLVSAGATGDVEVEDAGHGDMAMDDGTEMAMDDASEMAMDDEMAADDASETAADDDMAMDEAGEEGGSSGLILGGLVLLLGLAGVGFLAARRKDAAA